MAAEIFELELLGGKYEQRYRRQRPEVEALPWGTIRREDYPAEIVEAARTSWTGSAFQEYRTAVAVTQTLKCLLEARAPLDLIAMASRFPLDEVVHVELCARMAMELGGAVEIVHDPDALVALPREDLDPVLRCADLVVRFFCVGEAISIPMLRGTWHAATRPLARGVLGIIVRDEAAHGTFGFTYLDWALPLLPDSARAPRPLGRRHRHDAEAQLEAPAEPPQDGLQRRPRAGLDGVGGLPRPGVSQPREPGAPPAARPRHPLRERRVTLKGWGERIHALVFLRDSSPRAPNLLKLLWN